MFSRTLKLIKIDRPWIYRSIVAIGAILFTASNNYYYYSSTEKSETSRIVNLSKVMNSYSDACVINKENTVDFCIQDLKNVLHKIANKKSTYYGTYAHITINDKKIVLLQDRRYKDSREPIYLSQVISKDSIDLTKLPALNASIEIETNPTPGLAESVYRSMTLSIEDIISHAINNGYDDTVKFIWKTALPRSRPAFTYLLIAWFVTFLLRQSLIAKIRFVSKVTDDE